MEVMMEETLSQEQRTFEGSPSAVEGVHFDGLFRNEWDTWARSGRLDAKGLRTALPDVVEGIRNGKINTLLFAECLTWQEMRQARLGIEKIPAHNYNYLPCTPNMAVYFHFYLCNELVGQGPNTPSDVEVIDINPLNQLLGLLVSSMASDATIESNEGFSKYKSGFRPVDESDFYDFRETDYYAMLQYAFNLLCAKDDDFMKGMVGIKVKQHTPSLAKKRNFDNWMDNQFKHWADQDSTEYKAFYQRTKLVELKRQRILEAANFVKVNDDLLKRLCWECDTLHPNALLCGGCETACYCCKEHQRQAWKDGHKNSCKIIKTIREAMMTNLKRLETSVKSDDIMGGSGERLLRPCLEIDAMLMKGIMVYYSRVLTRPDRFRQSRSLITRYGPPSMDNYYRHLADVLNGERCFVFTDTPDLALRDSSIDGGVRKDQNDFEGSKKIRRMELSLYWLSVLMGFRPDSTREQMQLLKEAEATHSKSVFPRSMFHTAREFLEQYRSYHLEPSKICWKEVKKDYFDSLRVLLRRECHKLPAKPPGF